MAETFSEVIMPVLDTIIRFSKPDQLPTRDDMWQVQNLIAGGKSYRKFLAELRRYGASKICTTIWRQDSVAYRCNTCARVPTMALCEACFEPHKHQGHDYFFFININGGGKCDCGDEELCNPLGFCPVAFEPRLEPEKYLLNYAEASLLTFTIKTLIMITGIPKEEPPPTDSLESLMLSMLQKFSEESVFLKEIIVDALISKDVFNVYFRHEKKKIKNKKQQSKLRHLLHSHKEYRDGPFELVEDAIEECMLDSFFIWGLRRKIYSKVLKWFMVLNSDKNFKYALAKFFSKNYIYIILKMGHPPNEYLKKETHLLPISCQFLFWPSKAFILASEFNLLKAILFCLYYTLFKYNTEPVKLTIDLIFSDAAFDHKLLFEENDTENFNYHLVPLENFLQFLSNKDTAYYIVKNADITSLYIDIIKFVQGMDVNTKADYFQENVEEYRYFNAHNEVCMFPFWTIVHHFKQDTESFLDNNFFDAIFENLSNWVAYYPQELFRFSFHLPLHRISAILLASEMRKGILCNKNFKFCADFLVRAVQHPMRILAISSEVLIGTWLSNGDQLIIQSKLYRSANFSAGTIDPDYYLTQLAAAQLNPNYFTQLIFEIFLVIGLLRDDVLSFQYPHQRHFLLGNVLFFMAIIVSARVLAGKHEKNLLRSEVITSLATREKSFHVVIRSIPDRGPNVQPYWTKDLKTVLDSVAQLKPTMINDYSEPLDRIFTLNTKVFLEEYDPVMARMRSVSSRDYDESVRNYIQRVRNEKLSKDDPWPPFRSPIEPHHPFLNGFTNFLHCISLHAYIFIALHYCYKGFWPESTLQITIHLLNMSFKFPYYEPDKENNTRSETSCLYRNCMIPFDYEFNILSDYGLYDFLRQIDPPPYRTPYETHTGYFEKHHFQLFPIYGLEFATKPKRKLFSHIDRLYAMGPMQDIVHDTILSLLLKLFSNLTKKIYKPPYMRNEETVKYGSPSSTGVRIGGAEYFIGEVLDQLVEGCEEVLQEVERYVSIEMQNASGDDARAERRKKKLKTKKELLKQKMEAKRKNLLQEIEADAPSKEPLEEKPKCVICAQAFVSDPDNPVCQLSYVTRTNLLGHRVSQRHLELLYLAESTFSYNFEGVQSTYTSLTFFKKENLPWYDNMWIQTCGHLVHIICFYDIMAQTQVKVNFLGVPVLLHTVKSCTNGNLCVTFVDSSAMLSFLSLAL